MTELAKGMRVEPSPEAHKVFPNARWIGCQGTIIGLSKDKRLYRVAWDALVCPQTIHPQYIQPVEK